ncbi:hypothetical protein PoB_004043100 [Plakobranchus ocellatus]|uniref:Uncharacterized protein n=1 Tax=Plakobranchus ocellatus TaxID=259542 RepID=A0AAV4B075_9GAST|nr:hypothetical protein PoB_004043100 [Plakobranchus ocellatus]
MHCSFKSAGRDGVIGAQRIGALWRLYPRSPDMHAILLANGLALHKMTITIAAQNPFLIREADGQDIPRTRLTISDVPVSYSNKAIESALIRKRLKL